MAEEIKERAVELFRTFGQKVLSGEATGDDLGELREGLRGIAEELGLDLSGYEENIKPILDEAQENFDVEEFKAKLKPLLQRIAEQYEIDPEQFGTAVEE